LTQRDRINASHNPAGHASGVLPSRLWDGSLNKSCECYSHPDHQFERWVGRHGTCTSSNLARRYRSVYPALAKLAAAQAACNAFPDEVGFDALVDIMTEAEDELALVQPTTASGALDQIEAILHAWRGCFIPDNIKMAMVSTSAFLKTQA
jgi:hypothetical protein